PAGRSERERNTPRTFWKRLVAQHERRMDSTDSGGLHGIRRGMGVEGEYRRGHCRREVLSRHRRERHARSPAWRKAGASACSNPETSGVAIESLRAAFRVLPLVFAEQPEHAEVRGEAKRV